MEKLEPVWESGQNIFSAEKREEKINEIVDWINREEEKRAEARRILNESS